MLKPSVSLAISTSVLKALPGILDIKRHSPSILYLSVFELFARKKSIFRDRNIILFEEYNLQPLNIYIQ